MSFQIRLEKTRRRTRASVYGRDLYACAYLRDDAKNADGVVIHVRLSSDVLYRMRWQDARVVMDFDGAASPPVWKITAVGAADPRGLTLSRKGRTSVGQAGTARATVSLEDAERILGKDFKHTAKLTSFANDTATFTVEQ